MITSLRLSLNEPQCRGDFLLAKVAAIVVLGLNREEIASLLEQSKEGPHYPAIPFRNGLFEKVLGLREVVSNTPLGRQPLRKFR